MSGNVVVNLGLLAARFADQIPLHIASRKYALRSQGKAVVRFAAPAHMRFYALTQVLHSWGCSFTDKPANWGTMVRIKTRPCPVCSQPYLAQAHTMTCSSACAHQRRRDLISG